VVFGGPGTRFVDARVENFVRYVHEVRVRDAAGDHEHGDDRRYADRSARSTHRH
jgi:hypothetical protein